MVVLGFLDESIHAMCSKGGIKLAVAAASFSFNYLEIFQLQNQVHFLLSDKIIISCQTGFLAVLVT